MEKQKLTKSIDSLARGASLLGLLGFAAIAGLFNPEYFRWSFLSYLSFLSYFRFINLLVNPNLSISTQSIRGISITIIAAILPVFYIGLPGIGFLGFLGYFALSIKFISTKNA